MATNIHNGTAKQEERPDSMRAIEITTPGGPEVLGLTSMPTPSPGSGEVLVRVAAAGINRPDAIQRQGHYPPPPGAPETPGLEIAGTVVALGADTTGWQVGDELCALVAGGGYAEYCAVPTPQALPIPKGLGMVEAAALPETFFTVWSNLIHRARLLPDESLLVHGGTSGIGTTAIQLAAALGVTVYATAGSTEKCSVCERLGAAKGINYREEDFADVVSKETAGKGVNVILDMVGGGYISRNIACLAMDGRLVNIAFLEGPKAEVNFMPVMLKRLTITGSTLRARPIADKAAIAGDLLEQVWPLLAAGRIRPVIDSTFPLEEAAAAHERLEESVHIGKIVLTV